VSLFFLEAEQKTPIEGARTLKGALCQWVFGFSPMFRLWASGLESLGGFAGEGKFGRFRWHMKFMKN